MDNKKKNDINVTVKKKNKNEKNIQLLYNKLSNLIIHSDFLFKSKLIKQEFYMEQMVILSDLQNKVVNFELLDEKKK